MHGILAEKAPVFIIDESLSPVYNLIYIYIYLKWIIINPF